MPLTNCNIASTIVWNLATATSAFSSATQSDSLSGSVVTLNLTQWNQIYVTDLTLLPAASTSLDLTSMVNLVSESFSFAHVKALVVYPSGAGVKVGPNSVTNALVWFWNASTAYTTVQDGGALVFFDSASTTPANSTVVDGTHKIIPFTNIVALATAWNSGTSYVVGNTVSISSNNYVAIASSVNKNPTTQTAYWTLINVATVSVAILGSTT